MRPTKRAHAGFTLFELVLLIIVFSVGLAGILVVFNTATVGSVDPAMRKQSMALAESMMDEALLMPFAIGPGGGIRANFDDVRDYNGIDLNGVTDINGVAIAGLGNYRLQVAVDAVDFNGVASADLLRVTVIVTAPRPQASYTLVGFKGRY